MSDYFLVDAEAFAFSETKKKTASKIGEKNWALGIIDYWTNPMIYATNRAPVYFQNF